MKPIYKITANGSDLDLGERLISLSYSDESGFKSDTCSIILDDRDSAIAMPSTGANLSVYLGYESSGLSHIGDYIVNEITLSGSPDRISLKAHGVDFKSSLKEKISANYAGTTLGSLVASIASKHGLKPRISSDLAGIFIDHLAQTNESDMHFLTRLSEKYGAIAKPIGGNLVFAVRGLAQSASGSPLGVTTIEANQVISWSYSISKREDFGKVKAEYVDFEQAENHEIEEGSGDSTYVLQSVSDSENNAKTLAKTALSRLKKDPRKLQLSTIGNPNLIAESVVILSGFKPGIPTNWIITKAEHSLDSQGFKTQIEGEVYGEI